MTFQLFHFVDQIIYLLNINVYIGWLQPYIEEYLIIYYVINYKYIS